MTEAVAKDLENRFTYHPPRTKDDVENHEEVRDNLLGVARRLAEFLPEGREKSLMLTKIEEAMFWANAALARNRTNGT